MTRLTRRLRPATRDPRLDRALARAPRLLAAALAVLLMLAGLRTVLAGPPRALPHPQPAAPVVDLAAHGFVAELAERYLSFEPDDPDAHAAALRELVGEAFGAGLGLAAPAGQRQRVRAVRVVQDQPAIAGGRLVTVAVQTDRRGLLHLSIPVDRDREGRLRVAGYPALVGAPEHAAAQPPARRAVADEALAAVARRALTNYLARDGENLRADLAAGARVALPALALRVEGRPDVAAAGSAGVLVTVTARDALEARYTLTYELGVAFAGRWYVTAVHAFPHQP